MQIFGLTFGSDLLYNKSAMITVIDYGAGNLKSVCNALAFLGVKSEVTGDADKVSRADKLILPGVGAFGVCMEKLRLLSLDEAIKSAAGAGTPVLGICLGLQMLFDRSEEFGMHDGLGLLPGEVRRINSGSLPLPHIAWTSVEVRGGRLMAGIKSGEFFYFVHSYCARAARKEDEAAVASYGETFTAAAERDNVFGVQFHPEKSGERGLALLKNFIGV